MCNFIIRQEVKSYATVDLVRSELDGDVIFIEHGDSFEVDYIKEGVVYGRKGGIVDISVPLSTFVHTFSDKDPKKKKESK